MRDFLLKKISDANAELDAVRERQTILGAQIDAWKMALDAIATEAKTHPVRKEAADQHHQAKKRGRRPNKNWLELLRVCDGLTISQLVSKGEELGLREKAVRDQFRRYLNDNVTIDAEGKYRLTEKARKNIGAQSETASVAPEAVSGTNQAAASGTQSERLI
ncbi:hypothetical protein [Ralstonia chuxiongensis]|uniref:hypothetical protein n=1 Tax=Ralstonia chuxiongensis TaxID=2957504 RepID=UPI00292D3F0E|nr:hypothetical protein [Ralstonia chuxiongensis]